MKNQTCNSMHLHAAVGENGGGVVRQGMDCGNTIELIFIIPRLH